MKRRSDPPGNGTADARAAGTFLDVVGQRAVLAPTAYLLVASCAGGAVLFAANMMLAARFSVAEFGRFKTVIAFFSFLPVLLDMGAGLTIVRYLSSAQSGGVFSLVRRLMGLVLAAHGIGAVLLLLFRRALAIRLLHGEVFSPLIAAGIVLFMGYYFELFKQVALGLQRYRLYALSQFLALTASGAGAYVAGRSGGPAAAVLGWAFGYLAGNLVCAPALWQIRRSPPAGPPVPFSAVFWGYSLPLYIMMYPGFLGLAVIPLLSLFFRQELIGYLSLAMIFYQGITALPVALSNVLFTKFSAVSPDGERSTKLLRESLLTYTGLAALGACAWLCCAPVLIRRFFPAYASGLFVLNVLALFGFLSGYCMIVRSYLSSAGRLRRFGLVVFAQNAGLLLLAGWALSSVRY